MDATEITQAAHYVVNQNGDRVAVQLSMEAWQAILDLLGQPGPVQPHAPAEHKPLPKPAGPLRFGEVRARFEPDEYAERRD